MYRSSPRLKLTMTFFLLLALVVGLALLGFTKGTTHAAGVSLNFSLKSRAISAIPATACGAWNIVPSPSPGVSQNYLYGVVANSGSDIWAVGSYGDSDHGYTLTEHWDGMNWSVISSPNISTYNTLNAVAKVPRTNQIWAVGTDGGSISQTLIEHWDGTNWSIISSPNIGTVRNYLTGITVVTVNDIWAVGAYSNTNTGLNQTLIEHWNGTSWSVISSPNFGAASWLNGVVKVTKNDVWAVGAYIVASSGTHVALTLHWDGINWSSVPNPGVYDDVLNAVTRVPGTNQILASGYENTYTSQGYTSVPLIEHWDGTSWSSMPSPTNVLGVLYGVTSVSVKNAWVVGSLIEHWDGTNWNVVSNPSTGSILNAVTQIPGTKRVWAVGAAAGTLTEFHC